MIYSRKEGKGGRGFLFVVGFGVVGLWWGYWFGRWLFVGVEGFLFDRGYFVGVRFG